MTKDILKQNKVRLLAQAFLSIKTDKQMLAFLRDLLTESELEEFANRLEVAKLLDKGTSQRQVSNQTSVSIATVTRVNQWLKRGKGGYKFVIKKAKKAGLNHSHLQADLTA